MASLLAELPTFQKNSNLFCMSLTSTDTALYVLTWLCQARSFRDFNKVIIIILLSIQKLNENPRAGWKNNLR